MWEWECERVPLSFDDGVISNATNIHTDLIQMKLIACKRLANFCLYHFCNVFSVDNFLSGCRLSDSY